MSLYSMYQKINKEIHRRNNIKSSDSKFCYSECPNLNPTEAKQKKGEPHFCEKYQVPVFHKGAYPAIFKYEGCKFK